MCPLTSRESGRGRGYLRNASFRKILKKDCK
jgi:hypothetical protein